MPVERRREILSIAKAHDLAIFEDDCYADLIFEGGRPPAFRALDEDGRVVYCGSFSKSIAPALRVGYLVAGKMVLVEDVAGRTAEQVSERYREVVEHG